MRTALACYSLAVLAVLATALLKGPIEAHVGHGPPFILFLPAVTLGLVRRPWVGTARNDPGHHHLCVLLHPPRRIVRHQQWQRPVPAGPLRVGRNVDQRAHGATPLGAAVIRGLCRGGGAISATQPRSEERLQALLNYATAVISLKDAESRYLLVNRQFVLVFGVPGESILGQTDFDLFPRERAEQLRAQDRAVLETGPCSGRM